MIHLTLEVRDTSGLFRRKRELLYNGKPVTVPDAIAPALKRLAPGPVQAGCEYRPGGLVVVELEGVRAEAPPMPVAAPARREADPDVRARLDALGETELSSAAHELIAQLTGLLATDGDRAARAFPILLEAAGRAPSMPVDPPNLCAFFGALPEESRFDLDDVFLDWMAGNPQCGREFFAAALAEVIPIDRWPDALFWKAVESHARPGAAGSILRRLVDEGVRRAPSDRRLSAAVLSLQQVEAETQAKKEREKDLARERRAGNLRHALAGPARVDTVEDAFGIKLPREFRRAWQLATDVRFLTLGNTVLKELLAKAEAISRTHFADDASPAFLPVLEKDGETIGLYLGIRRPDADYAVVAIGTEVRIVATTSGEWLAAG